ncbi:MAG: GatB/YqeY domain-containing protein [Clostridia bacterium]|nr:GatB/YqeY domain-containing protein [Clostridia bacterium]
MRMKEELLQELKEAMRDKDIIRKNTITLLRSAILQVEKDTQKELSDEEIVGIVAKEVKKRKDSIGDYEKAGRDDIIADLNKEIEILSKYLPKQLTVEEIHQLVDGAIKNVGATSPRDMGKVMQDLRAKIAGKADGKVVSEIVKEKLNQ